MLASTALAGDAKVSGQVTVDGKPIAAAKIIFHLSDGEFVGRRSRTGSTRSAASRTGAWKVTIEGKGVSARYSSEDRAVLTVEVKEGAVTFDFDLTSK